MELTDLNNKYNTLVNTLGELTAILDSEVKGETRERIAQKLYERIPDTAEFEDFVADKRHNSAQLGSGTRLTR
jgi:hypothetical protein